MENSNYKIDVNKPLNHNDIYHFLKEKKGHSKDIARLYNNLTNENISLPYRLTKPILLKKIVYPLKEKGLEKEFKTLLKEHPVIEEKKKDLDKKSQQIQELAGKIKSEPTYKYLLDKETRQRAELYLEKNPNIPQIKLSSKDHLNLANLWQKEMNSSIEQPGISKGMTADNISEKVSEHYRLHEYLSQENKLNIANNQYNSLLQKEVEISKAILDKKYSQNDFYNDEILRDEKLKEISSNMNISFEDLKSKFSKDSVIATNTSQTNFKIDDLLKKEQNIEINDNFLLKDNATIYKIDKMQQGDIFFSPMNKDNIQGYDTIKISEQEFKKSLSNKELIINPNESQIRDTYKEILKDNDISFSDKEDLKERVTRMMYEKPNWEEKPNLLKNAEYVHTNNRIINLDRNKNGIEDKLEKNLYKKDLEEFGIDINSPKNKSLKEDLLAGNKTKATTFIIESKGKKFEIDAKLSLKENEKGQKELRIHPLRKDIKNDINLSEKDLERLKQGEIIEKTINGKTQLIQLDKDINELMKVNKKDLQIPDKIKNIELTTEQKSSLIKGKSIKIGNKNSKHLIKLDFGKNNKISIKKEKSISKKMTIKR